MPVTRRSVARAALPAALLGLALLAGCSNGQSAANREPHQGSAAASPVNGVQQITVRVNGFRFVPSTITVHPGKVRVVLVNDNQGAPHNWQLPDFPADFVPLDATGQTKEATFTAPSPGTYRFVCTIHEKQGMTGSLVVVSG